MYFLKFAHLTSDLDDSISRLSILNFFFEIFEILFDWGSWRLVVW